MLEASVPKISDLMKTISAGVVNSMQLPEVYIGTVSSVNPLEIRHNQQNVIPSKFLTLTNAVKDHDVDITISWTTEDNVHKHGNGNGGADTAEVTHKHGVKGRKRITIHNGLTKGEKVLLLRVQGGQNYVVVDRLDKIQTSGENV